MNTSQRKDICARRSGSRETKAILRRIALFRGDYLILLAIKYLAQVSFSPSPLGTQIRDFICCLFRDPKAKLLFLLNLLNHFHVLFRF